MNRAELRLLIRQRADMVGSSFVTDDEIDAMIDSSVSALHDIITDTFGNDYFSRTTWFQLTGLGDSNVTWPRPEFGDLGSIPGPDTGIATCFQLPEEFVRLVRVQFFKGTISRNFVQVGVEASDLENMRATTWSLNAPDKRAYPMHRIETAGQVFDYTPRDWFQTHVAYRLRRGPIRQLAMAGTTGGGVPFYQFVNATGSCIEFLPVPTGSVAVQVDFVPKPMLLPDHPYPEYLTFDCAALCVEKQRSDSTVLRTLQDRVVSRIRNDAKTVDAASPPMAVDIYGSNRLPRSNGEPWPL